MRKNLLTAACIIATTFCAQAQDPQSPFDCQQTTAGTVENGGFFGGDGNQSLAIDIPIYEGTTFDINTVKVNTIGPTTFINIIIREDAGGLPGNILNTYNNVAINSSTAVGENFGFTFYQLTLDVSSLNISFSSPSGDSRYWMQIQSDAVAWESIGSISVGLAGAFMNDGTTPPQSWTIGTGDYVYELIGECTGDIPVVYCNGAANSCQFELITNVEFGEILNTTDCGSGLNDYTDMEANVTIGEPTSLTVSVEADDDDFLFVFIDWNQNGVLNDEGEVYILGNNLTAGEHTLTESIIVPADAVVGQTRMRIFLSWDNPDTTPCSSVSWGEVEDYTVNIQAAASTIELTKSKFTIYPNPANDVINISAVDTIEKVSISDLNGRVVKQATLGVNEAQINISDLSQGVYILNAVSNGKTVTEKIIKK